MTARSVLLLIALHAGVAACSGTETGNPAGARVALGIRASDPAVVSVGTSGTGSRVEALLLAVDSATLIGCAADAGSTPLFEGKAVVDLVQGAQSDPVPAGEYCGVHVALVRGNLPGAGDAPAISGATVAAHGVRADGVPFTVVSRTPLTAVARGEPFEVHEGDTLVFAFDASLWLGGGILDAASVVDGRATIDGTGDSAAQFERQIAAGLFQDTNGDGAVDDGETTPLVATDSPALPP